MYSISWCLRYEKIKLDIYSILLETRDVPQMVAHLRQFRWLLFASDLHKIQEKDTRVNQVSMTSPRSVLRDLFLKLSYTKLEKKN
uniref:Uncharacterized protein n=1 Tax=Nelumbo nucifera TaxID=4432 RepID=A0A822ZSS9_NELNU|nr:TPA_asm: hypothetical protein HUJ06_017889 [Nelumbo nucifera]